MKPATNRNGQAGAAENPDPACCLAGTPARRLPHDAAVDRERDGRIRHVKIPPAVEAASGAHDRPGRDSGRKRNEVACVEHGSPDRSGRDGVKVTLRNEAPQSAATQFGSSRRPSVAYAQRRSRRRRHLPGFCRAGSMSRYFQACSRFTCFLYPSTHGRTREVIERVQRIEGRARRGECDGRTTAAATGWLSCAVWDRRHSSAMDAGRTRCTCSRRATAARGRSRTGTRGDSTARKS